jgi:membrane protein involved in colicin uptake
LGGKNDKECRTCASEKKAADTFIVNLTCRLTDMSKRDLETLHKNIEEELKKRRSTTTTVDDLINELKQAYASLDWGGGDWKSEKTSDAVRKLESVGPKEIEMREMIINLDIQQKWKAARLFTQVLVSMINTAEDYAGKLVNGSCGEWCPLRVCKKKLSATARVRLVTRRKFARV